MAETTAELEKGIKRRLSSSSTQEENLSRQKILCPESESQDYSVDTLARKLHPSVLKALALSDTTNRREWIRCLLQPLTGVDPPVFAKQAHPDDEHVSFRDNQYPAVADWVNSSVDEKRLPDEMLVEYFFHDEGLPLGSVASQAERKGECIPGISWKLVLQIIAQKTFFDPQLRATMQEVNDAGQSTEEQSQFITDHVNKILLEIQQRRNGQTPSNPLDSNTPRQGSEENDVSKENGQDKNDVPDQYDHSSLAHRSGEDGIQVALSVPKSPSNSVASSYETAIEEVSGSNESAEKEFSKDEGLVTHDADFHFIAIEGSSSASSNLCESIASGDESRGDATNEAKEDESEVDEVSTDGFKTCLESAEDLGDTPSTDTSNGDEKSEDQPDDKVSFASFAEEFATKVVIRCMATMSMSHSSEESQDGDEPGRES